MTEAIKQTNSVLTYMTQSKTIIYNRIYLFLFLVLTTSCYSTRKTVYFHKIPDTTFVSKFENEIPIIHQNDLLSIKISSLNEEATEIFNPSILGNSSMGSTIAGTSSSAHGYLVDPRGSIQLPILGTIKAEGLTTMALKDTILNQLVSKNLLKDPVVTVRFLNFRISVMGEVENPSVYNIPSEKITLLEALALAGDLTVFSRRDNILVIREEKGEKKLARLNLRSSEIFTSPYYYLKSNDVVYVEHNKAKVASSKSIAPWLSAVFSASSLIIVIINNVK